MSNRRIGGNMGGGNRGLPNRSYNQPFQGNVNPWQGGIMNQGGGLLSQLSTNPQQLALALSTLLQPQVQAPPSLMSLNSNNSGMNRGRDFNRFDNRGGRDNRRHEPYNKNRGGQWRDNNRNRNQGNANRNKNQKDDKKKDNKDEKKEVKKGKDTKNDADQSMDEEEKKRDWKDEKKTAEDDDEENDEKTEDKDEDKSNKEGKFFKIPPQFLSCFICNKQMWDGESMEKHLKGRAHSEMIKALEESIGITVNILRENMRLTEERNLIEMHRIQRTKKFNKFRGPEEQCNMCDLRFRGKMSSHRRGEGHQRLKRYLHPKCNMCDKEFHARIEWIEHRLTPDHLRKHCEKLEESAETAQRSSDGASIIINLDEQDSQEMDLDKLLLEPTQMESDNPITELDDSLENMQNRYPAYKSDRPVGSHAIKEFAGFLCELCNRSFTNQEDSQRHLKSQRHYYKFIETIKERFDEKEKKEKEEREEKERKEKEDKEKAEENGDEEEAEEADQEMDDSLNDSAMETADETLNNTQEDTMEDSQVSQEEDQILEEEEEVVVLKEEKVEEVKIEKPSPKKVVATPAANKPGPASKKAAAAAANRPGPASSKVAANTASPAARGRKARK